MRRTLGGIPTCYLWVATVLACSLFPQELSSQDDVGEPEPEPEADRQPRRPRVGVTPRVGVRIDLGKLLGGGRDASDPFKFLEEEGPQFPPMYSMSHFVVQGFVKGSWPVVIDYEIAPSTFAFIEIAAEGVRPFYYQLAGSGRRLEILRVPERFGATTKIAEYRVRAMEQGPGEMRPVTLRIYALGAGDRAVGSVSIDSLRFRPEQIRSQQEDIASYRFHSRGDFPRTEAEFFRLQRSPDDEIIATWVEGEKIKNGVKAGRGYDGEWDGMDDEGEPSIGHHLLQVRAWRDSRREGDWVAAQSAELVRVE